MKEEVTAMLRVQRQQPLQASFLDDGENSVTTRFHPTKHMQQIAFVLIAGVNIVEGKALKYLTFEKHTTDSLCFDCRSEYR